MGIRDLYAADVPREPLLGALVRALGLGDRLKGDLVTLDAIYEVQHAAFDADEQTALARLFSHPDVRDDALALRAAKAVALLGLLQAQVPTTSELVARCLDEPLDPGSQNAAVSAALERLRGAGLLSHSESEGYAIQSSAGQEWQREREDLGVAPEQISELVRDALKELVGAPERGRLKGRSFPWSAWYSDEKQANDVRLQDPRDEASVTVDFRYLLAKEERTSTDWVRRSEQVARRDRIVWVIGEPGRITPLARDLARSRYQVGRNEPRKGSLSREKQRLLAEELRRLEDLELRLRTCVAEAFFDGNAYFRGRVLRPQDFAGAFAAALTAIATRVLPELYPHFTEIVLSDAELSPLLDPSLESPPAKLLEGGLGIFSRDDGRIVPTCGGAEPTRILQFVTESGGTSGATVIARFGRPPYGYPPDVVKACLAGLLRAGRIRIHPGAGPELASIEDPGAAELFRRERELRRAELFPPKEEAITARDRVAICSFFKKHLDFDLERQNDAIADAVFQCFPKQRDAVRAIEKALDRLPGRPELPEALQKLGQALEDCCRSRHAEEIVIATKRHLDALASGMEQLDTAEATASTPTEIRDRFLRRWTEAEEKASAPRSEPQPISRGGTLRAPVVKVEARVHGREIATREQLEELLAELRGRVEAQLEDGARVRLV